MQIINPATEEIIKELAEHDVHDLKEKLAKLRGGAASLGPRRAQ